MSSYDYKKRKLSNKEKLVWIPLDVYEKFNALHPNFQGWVLEQIIKEVETNEK